MVQQQHEQQRQQQREQHIQSSLDSPADQALHEIRWLHMVHGWPLCPPDIPVADWLGLLRLAQRSCAYVQTLPCCQASRHTPHGGERMRVFQSLCVTELEQYYRNVRSPRPVHHYDDPLDTEALRRVTERIRGGPRVTVDPEESPIPPPSPSSPSSVVDVCVRWRQRLVGVLTFPWTATWLGLVLADTIVRGRSQSWPGLLRYMVQLSHTNPAALPNHIGQQTMIHNPSHMPTQTPP